MRVAGALGLVSVRALFCRMLCARSLALACALTSAMASACGPPALRPFPDRPLLTRDDDRHPLGQPPRPRRRGNAASVLAHQVSEPLDRWLRAGDGIPARNVNALGAVPASSWFQPRRHPLSAEALRRGAATSQGPSLLGPWIVTSAGNDSEGRFLVVTDEDALRFQLRFDAPGHPHLATTASLVSTLILHALGFHVPERHLVIFEPAQLRLPGGDAFRSQRRPGERASRPPTQAALSRLLSPIPRLGDGSLRAVATRLDGSVDLGPFRWVGTRPDDPNDFVPHELRRELRGLGPAAAWLNLTGITEEVPRDLYYPDPGRRHVVHSLFSLRGSLGSTRAGRPKPLWEGFAPLVSLPQVLGRLVSLGALPEPWRRLEPSRQRALRTRPGLGWLPRDSFSPKRWSPRLHNEAFRQADSRDLHWGASLVSRLGRAQLKTIVQEAYLPHDEAEALLSTLWHRRQAVLQAWLGQRAPLYEVRLETPNAETRLCVTDLWHREGLSRASFSRDAAPARSTPRSARVGAPVYEARFLTAPAYRPGPTRALTSSTGQPCLPLPQTLTGSAPRGGDYLVVELRRPEVSQHWLRVHLRRLPRNAAVPRAAVPHAQGPTWRLAGLER